MKLSELKGYKVIGAAPNTPAAIAQEAPKKDFLDKATDVVTSIFPGKQVGQAIGTLAGYVATPVERKPFYNLDAPKPLEVAGDIAAGAATVAGFKGVGTGSGLIKNALQSAALGAATSGGKSVAEGSNFSEVVKDTALGAAVGGGTSLALGGVEKALQGFRALPQRLVRSATGQTKTDILAGKDITKYVLENKKIGTAEQIIAGSQKAIDRADSFINESLKSVTNKTVPVKDIVADIADSINAGGGEIDEAGVRSILESLAPQVKKTLGMETLTLAQANKLRSQLDKTLGNRAFINAQLPYNKGILMDFTNAIREQVKGNAPEGVRAAFNTYSKEIKLRDLLVSKIAGGQKNQIIGLGDLISAGVGGTFGGLPGAVALGAGKKAIESVAFKTGAAVTIDRLDEALSPILAGLEPALQTTILNAIASALAKEGNQSLETPK